MNYFQSNNITRRVRNMGERKEFWQVVDTDAYKTALEHVLASEKADIVETVPSICKKIFAKPAGYWNNTGIFKARGVSMIISYAGEKWRSNPHWGPTDGAGDGRYIARSTYLRPGAPEGCLIGKVEGSNTGGGSETFALGNFGYVPVELEGLLWLTVNDEPPGFGDNSGYIRVTVS